MATVTITDIAPIPSGYGNSGGGAKTKIVTVDVSGTYTSGGDTLSASTLGAQKVLFFEGEVLELSASTALVPRYDYTNGKLKLYKANGTTNLTEFGAATATGSFRARVTYI